MSKYCFTQMIDYNSKDLVWILTKIDNDYCLWTPYKCTKFQRDWLTCLRVRLIFQVFEKTNKQKKRRKNLKVCSLISWKCDFLQIWCVVSLGRQAPPQQLWCSLDKRTWSYECVKNCDFVVPVNIVVCAHPVFLGRMTHFHVS